MKKWIILAVVLAGGAWGFQKWRNSLPGTGASATDTHRATAVVETRDIHFAVSAAGEIGPAEQVSVRPEINGKILTLPVDIGDRVKKDSVLFTLDDQDLQTERSSRLIEIEAAKLQLEKAKRDYERSKQLYADKLISQELFEDTRTQYELARNALDRTEKALHLVEYQLTKTKILAPFDCTVLTRPVSVGQAVSGSGGFNSGTEVLTIANLNEMIINAHINQADVTRLKISQEVDVAVEAVPGLRITGTVERIAPQATIKNNIKGFAARILLTDVEDRKSTRLNSSHSQISYAVFCLKKKKKQTTIQFHAITLRYSRDSANITDACSPPLLQPFLTQRARACSAHVSITLRNRMIDSYC